MKLLVVGSKGFIGSHVFRFFRSCATVEVWGCDVVTDYPATNYFLIDATNADFNSIFSKQNFDVCINCSGAASVPDSINNPLRDYLLNCSNVFLLLEAIRKNNPQCKYINLSSAAVYGNPASLPVKEDAALKPVSPYGKHKEMAEQVCKEFTSFFNIPTCSLRIFSAYGPGLRKQLFWDLYKKSKNSTVRLFGTGNESRDFIYVMDIVRAIEVLIMSAPFEGECYNLANGVEVKIKDAVDVFFQSIGWKGNVEFIGTKRIGDPDNWQADISKIKGLGYTQTISLKEGLFRYGKWIREND